MALNLRDYQHEAVLGVCRSWYQADRVLVSLPTGCHAKGQGILLHCGHVIPVEDVVVGEKLMGPDGKSRIVESLRRGQGRMCRISPVKGQSWVVNEDHILVLIKTQEHAARKSPSNRGGRIVEVSVKEWLKWSAFKKHVYKLFRVAVPFCNLSTLAVDPYFLGVLLGDGSLRRTAEVTTADREIVHEVYTQAEHWGIGVTVKAAGGKSKTYHLSTGNIGGKANPLVAALRGMKAHPLSASTKHIPFQYKTASMAVRAELLAGLMDTDGNVTCGGFDYISKSPALAHDVAFVARSLGLAAYVKSCKKTCVNNGVTGTYHRVSISGDTDIIPCRVPHKKQSTRKQKKDVLRTGFSVSQIGTGGYYGFTLSGDGRYLLDDFTVTHNTGKTRTAAYLVDAWEASLAADHHLPNRVLWLAHRDELIWQAAGAIEAATGFPPAIEKGSMRVTNSAEIYDRRVVVSSMQTMMRDDRRLSFGASQFGMVVVDEAHHAVAEKWMEVINYFTGAKLVGLTATADRSDEVSLSKIFQKVAYHLDLLKAIQDGWLCRPMQRFVRVEGLDLLTPRGGESDYTDSELEEIFEQEKPLHTLVSATVQESGNRPTLIFTPGVASAEGAARMLTDRYGKSARAISGKTPEDERRQIIDDFRAGQFQYLASCAVLLEGFDAPNASCLVMARPTKSRLLYAQAIGRILRGGVNCPVPGKTDALVIDLVGASLKHKLVHAADLLGGKYEDVVGEAAANSCWQKGSGEDGKPADVLEEVAAAVANASELLREQRKGIIAEAKLKRKTIDPFTLVAAELELGVAEGLPEWWKDWPASEEQKAKLSKNGVNTENALTMAEANALIRGLEKRQKEGLCTFKQARMLRARSLDPGMTIEQASSVMQHFAHRPGGFAFTPEDGKAKSMAKKKGRFLQYKELPWLPKYMVPAGSECATVNQRFHSLSNQYVGQIHQREDGRIEFYAKGVKATTNPWEIIDLHSNRRLVEPPISQTDSHDF